ncbi:hypothetical protein KSF_035340 [Reticulibacter mediterranei]|uniref:Uncharacterized protein n=1 Tax=Reticulibacter mediterranei TaxID=2778369 RepID=A0A8J3IQC3_9CHLR|nr:hypothetical protein [Reticulibacter mediterranei]GHO93486.1 hypothetical protein KSF_035340 [Reticulibacter mediterranei]
MAENKKKRDEFDKEKEQAQYGSSGNEGLYGKGQYTNQGKPDQKTEQAHQLKPDNAAQLPLGETAEQTNRELEGKIQRSNKKLSTN